MTRFPVSTYRLQFNSDFTFKDAAAVVPYLHALGITDCYPSSLLKAVPQSSHGYDLVDHSRLNPELGTEEDFMLFARRLREHDMGLLLDVIPNHMGIDSEDNGWWWDVLQYGPGSAHAAAFDINWTPVKRELHHKVLLPILSEQYGAALEQQDLRLQYEEGAFYITYGARRLPLTPRSWANILSLGIAGLSEEFSTGHQAVVELQRIAEALSRLSPRPQSDSNAAGEREREVAALRDQLSRLTTACAEARRHIAQTVATYNGTKGLSATFDRLDALLNDQYYRLASWRTASDEINYRRFFDVNELAAVRTEDPRVFEDSHRLIFCLLTSGIATGVRIDHVDGLYDPEDYLRRLQQWAAQALPVQPHEGPSHPLFIVVEKILGRDESLPETWPIAGTTGYDFLNLVGGLFIEKEHEPAMSAFYKRFTGRRHQYRELCDQAKHLIMQVSMSSEINELGHQLNRLSESHRRYRDFTLNSLTRAVREIIACLPVYRSYLTPDREPPRDQDRAVILRAVSRAKYLHPTLSDAVFDFVRNVLLGEVGFTTGLNEQDRIRFVTTFQQITGAVMAKGVEDTACYRYYRLVSLNEVGGDPSRFGHSVDVFHQKLEERRARRPHSMLTTSTHDTKRGEDVRARINVLSELPNQWRSAVGRWSRRNQRYRTEVDETSAPDRNDEYLLYQTLIGAWPLDAMSDEAYADFCGRIEQYMLKAVREAKLHTSWINRHEAYETALCTFIRGILSHSPTNPFLADFLSFHADVARFGMYNGLAQILLKTAGPGISDCYQGAELWELHLVDPDNRGPVDYAVRAAIIQQFKHLDEAGPAARSASVHELTDSWRDGRLKLYVLWTALQHRKRHPTLYLDGAYLPLECTGRRRSNLCAFARMQGKEIALAVVPRLLAGSMSDMSWEEYWQETWIALPPTLANLSYQNRLTGERTPVLDQRSDRVLEAAAVFKHCPVALLSATIEEAL